MRRPYQRIWDAELLRYSWFCTPAPPRRQIQIWIGANGARTLAFTGWIDDG